ncbi:ATP-binding protein [Aliivibrio kagoshimensis]|uniref:ATP-binding protein n=1 Tax=Aliivibrio kagoshimensis TaxID=2910230 RepID=UPI003D0D68FA
MVWFNSINVTRVAAIKYSILCLNTNAAEIDAIRSDFSFLQSRFNLIFTSSYQEAENVVLSMSESETEIALVVCGGASEQNKTFDFLIQLHHPQQTKKTRKLLISDHYTMGDVLRVVNQGRLDHCFESAWNSEQHLPVIIHELTTFILENDHGDWLKYSELLDQERILKAHIVRKMSQFQAGFINDYHNIDDTELAQQVITTLYDIFKDNDKTRACRTYHQNHLLTKEGEPNRFLWFIAEGKVALYKSDDDGEQHEVVQYSSGNIVGSMSFVSGERSFSTAITLTSTKVIKLDRTLFSKIMHNNSELLPQFSNLLLRHFNRRLQGSIKTKIKLQQTVTSLDNAYQQLIEREKMAVLGQLVAGVAHELNNPISAIIRGSDNLKQKISHLINSPLPDHIQQIGSDVFKNGLVSNPTSTSVTRVRAKEIESLVKDRVVAKKMVQMGLDDEAKIRQFQAQLGDEFKETVTEWEQYSLAGNTIRSMSICAQRIADLVKSLKGYAREDDETIHFVNIHEGIEDTLIIFENRLKHHNVIKHYSDIPEVPCQPFALQQVWTNIISNAIDALPKNGEFEIKTEIIRKESHHYLSVSFKDNGNGIPPEIIDKIFELNYTTKREGNFGLGIGLSVSEQIVKHHGGWFEVESEPEMFTKMTVVLPLHSPLLPLSDGATPHSTRS